jgi:hypothetical protein
MSNTYTIGIIYTATSSTLVGIDYTSEMGRIATAMETIASKMSAIESHQQTMVTLAQGNGIHVVNPYDWAHAISMYNWYIAQGNTLTNVGDSNSFASVAKQVVPPFPKYL